MQAALDLLDEAGMDGLTVRALAARLGVQAPALYWHVRNKQALLDEMATLIWRRVGDVMAGLPASTPWRELMSVYAATIRAELLGHRDGAKAFSGTTLTDPEVVRRQEVTLGTLTSQGFTLPDAVRGLLLINNFTIGFCVEEQAVHQVTASGDDRYRSAGRADRPGRRAAGRRGGRGDLRRPGHPVRRADRAAAGHRGPAAALSAQPSTAWNSTR